MSEFERVKYPPGALGDCVKCSEPGRILVFNDERAFPLCEGCAYKNRTT